MPVEFGVLGPVMAWRDGEPLALRGPRHRAVLGRLIVARGAVVPVERLVADLWADPPPRAVGAVRTFVSDLRRALGDDREVLATEGPGYALRVAAASGAAADASGASGAGASGAGASGAGASGAGGAGGAAAVDAWRFEDAVAAAAALPGPARLARLAGALALWRGPAFAGLDDQDWALVERGRLAELRLHAVEQVAEARLRLGLAAEAVPDLDAHVAAHPWREEGWRLLALALVGSGRRGDALAVLRRAHAELVEQLGVEPGEPLRRLQQDILHGAEAAAAGVDDVWARATAAYDREVGARARVRLESTVGLLRTLAVTGGGGLSEARTHRLAAIAAAEELGDPLLTARVIGAYDVPAIWARSDDPEQAAAIVAAARRALLADLPDAARAPLLATIALESRGGGAGPEAREAERLARALDDPALLAFALNGRWMQSFERAGLAPERDAIGAELHTLATRHGLPSVEVLAHLIRMQARSALGDFAAADGHAAAADRLDARHERPLVAVFTGWYRAMRAGTAAAYRDAAARLGGAGMPGFERGLPALALLSIGVVDGDFGPYEPWARPHVLLARGEPAGAAVRAVPDPPADLLLEALWCLTAKAAAAVGERRTLERARAQLTPAADEHAAGSGVLTLGPVADYLAL